MTFPLLVFMLSALGAADVAGQAQAPAVERVVAAGAHGRVLDRSGSPLAGVAVTLRQELGFERSVRTDTSGGFEFRGLPPGDYTLTAAAERFASVSRPVTLAPGRTERIHVRLDSAHFADEVTVSASHLASPESLQRLPGSYDVIDRTTLESSHVSTTSEALRKVSGVTVREEEGFGLRPNIALRGVNPTRSSKVLLLEDGIPLTYAPYGDNATYYHPPIERFQAIEVLKGSGQIAYGPVTVAGVVNYITPAPPIEPAGTLTTAFGNRDYWNGNLAYGGTWNDLGVALSYLRKQSDGARDSVHSDINDLNLKLVKAFAERHSLTVKGTYYGERSQVTYSGLRQSEYEANPRANPFHHDSFKGNRYGVAAIHTYSPNRTTTLVTHLYGSYFSRDWWRQSSNSGQRPNDSNDPACVGMANLDTNCGNEGRLREYKLWGLEPRLRFEHHTFGAASETELGARIHFETQERQQQNGETPTARSGTIVENNRRENRALSAFAQNRFRFGKWTLTPGVRVERIAYERTNRLANSGLGVSGSTDLTQLVPGVGVAFASSDNLTAFAGVHRGFAPPRTEDVISNAGGTIELDPELSWNYELGLRGSPRSGLTFDATLFRMDYENQIVPASLAGGVGAALTNGGKTLHQGVEVGARLDSAAWLRSAHNAYLRLAFTKLGTARFEGVRFSNVSGSSTVRVDGNRLPYAPERALNLTVGYTHPSGVDLSLEANYVGDQFGDDLNTVAPSADGQRGLLAAHTLWNASLNFPLRPLRSTLFLTVKNLFDETVIVDRTRGILPSSPRLFQGGFRLSL